MKNCQQQIRYWLPPVFLLLILILGCDEPATTDSNEPEEKIEYLVGESYFGRNNYIQYKVGNLPLIIAAPHGGSEKPEEIPDRSWGSTVKDAFTLEMSRVLADSLNELTGKQVHLITCLLHRSKLDANRDLDEAAQGNGYAGTAWTEYHNFINVAKEKVTEEFGHGLYIDLHGQSRRPRIELGYLLDDVDLMLPDSVLDEPLYVEKSSLTIYPRKATRQSPVLQSLTRGKTATFEGGTTRCDTGHEIAAPSALYRLSFTKKG